MTHSLTSLRRTVIAAALLGGLAALASESNPAHAEAATSIAVAANFTEPAKMLATAFEKKTGHLLTLSFGSSGQFVSQMTQGAPFEVFLSADAARPKKLVTLGLGVPGTVFTYAVGKLVLWSATPGLVDASGQVLAKGAFTHLAICNPKAAPYGAAAVQTLQSLGLYQNLQSKLITGESIAQAYQFVASGNAELGFVAYSQVIHAKTGSLWMVPQTAYQPIVQDAVLLKAGAGDPAAHAFLAFLKTPEALTIIRSFGYVAGQ